MVARKRTWKSPQGTRSTVNLRGQIWLLQGTTKANAGGLKWDREEMMGGGQSYRSFHHIKELWSYLEVPSVGKKADV